MSRIAVALVVVLTLSSSDPAHAQPSDEDRVRAAEAYDRGAAALRAEDYGESAGWFERANQLAPSPIALVQAVRAHLRARNFLRAGTLALSLEGDTGLTPRVVETVREAIGEATARYVRVSVSCSATCTLTLDGEAQPATRFFLEPDREAVVVATFSNGTRTETISGAAGETKEVAIVAPEGAISVVDDDLYDDSDNPYRIASSAFLSRPRAAAITAMAITAAVAGITVWSAVDARRSGQRLDTARDDGSPDDEVSRRRWEHDRDVHRTRGWTGLTGIAVVGTVVAIAFTDWTPEREPRATTAGFGASRDGAIVDVTHHF